MLGVYNAQDAVLGQGFADINVVASNMAFAKAVRDSCDS
jgi:hypothetical protein